MKTFICRSSNAKKIANYLDSYYPHEFTAEGTKVFCGADLKDDEWLNEIKEHAKGYHRGIEDTLSELAALRAENAELREALKALMKDAAKNAERYAPNGNEAIWALIDDASDALYKKREWSADDILKREG